jgi:hypothetical protein
MYNIGDIMNNIFLRNISYFFQMIGIDSILCAINFFVNYVNQNLTDQQIVTKSNELYSGSVVDRYIYYFLVYFMYNTVCTFFWVSDINILYYLGIVTIFPIIINKIFKSSLFKAIREKKELFVKLIITKILSLLIKFYSKTYLQKKIKNFKHTDLLPLLSDYSESIGYFSLVLKNFIIILLLSYVKKYSTKMYYDIIKLVYNYKTGELLESFNGHTAKEYLINIIDNRNWGKLKKTNTYNAILKVYQNNVAEIDIFKIISDEINFILVKVFSIWTLASLFGSVYFVPVLSLFLILYKYVMTKGMEQIRDIGIILCTVPLCTVCNSYFVLSILFQCLPKIIFNNVSYKLCTEVYGYVKENVNIIDIYEKRSFIPVVSIVLYMSVIRLFNLKNVLMLLNVLFNIIHNEDKFIQILYGLIICTTYLSDFCISHVIFNTIIVFGCGSYRKKIKWLSRDYVREYVDYGIDCGMIKMNICKKIGWNIVSVVLRKEQINYELYGHLWKDKPIKVKKNVVVEDFIFNDEYSNGEKKNVNNDSGVYNIVDNYY